MIIVKVKGGLGNQLFQYALAYRLYREFGYNIILDLSFYKGQFSNLFRLDKFNISYASINSFESKSTISNKFKRPINNFIYYKFPYWIWPSTNEINIDNLNNTIWKLNNLGSAFNYYLTGWMQNVNYFMKYNVELSNLFWLKSEYLVNESYKNEILGSNSISVHLRRGDMEKNANFSSLGKVYYDKAFNYIYKNVSNPHFFVFSDEPEKARLFFPRISNITFISENSQSVGYFSTLKDYQDFQLMRYCNHHIIANSTFSWWPAYLNSKQNKIVVSPKQWFNNSELQRKFNNSGLLLDNWIIL